MPAVLCAPQAAIPAASPTAPAPVVTRNARLSIWVSLIRVPVLPWESFTMNAGASFENASEW